MMKKHIKRILFTLIVLVITGCEEHEGIDSSESHPAKQAQTEKVLVPGEVKFSQGLPVPVNKISNLGEYQRYLIETEIRNEDFLKGFSTMFREDESTTTPEEQRAYYKKAAEAGINEAKVHYADALNLGQGGFKDEQAAYEWYQSAYESGSGIGAYALSSYYADIMNAETGEVRDIEKALSYAQTSAKRGFVLGGEAVGILLLAQREYKKAFEILSLYAEKGMPNSLMQLANMYKEGLGIKQDESKYHELLTQAAALEWPEAVYLVARHHFLGEYGFNGGHKAYSKHIKRAAELGSTNAKEMICIQSVSKKKREKNYDFREDLAICKEAAEAGELIALHSLSEIYYYDETGLKDIELSKTLLLKGAAAGDFAMIRNVATGYTEGVLGFEKDMDKACDWAEIGARSGYPLSIFLYVWILTEDLKGDVPKLEKPDYYNCAIWAGALFNIVKVYHETKATKYLSEMCKNKYLKQVEEQGYYEKKINQEIDFLTRKYTDSSAVIHYWHHVQEGTAPKIP